jgi:CheY-like chemotaxis protein
MKTASPTILMIDDDADFLFLAERAFRKNGVITNIKTAESGSEGIAYVMGEKRFADRTAYPYPTFIITDLKMPSGDGFAVLEHLKSNPAWAVIPVVVLTGSSDKDDIKKAYMLGASAFHVKPTEVTGLQHQLKVLHDYWMTCEVPQVDSTGRQLTTNSKGKLGERFDQPDGGEGPARLVDQ